jgi:hypothetical protein
MNFKNTKFSKPFPFVLLLQCPRSSSECVIVVQSDTCWFLITIFFWGGELQPLPPSSRVLSCGSEIMWAHGFVFC